MVWSNKMTDTNSIIVPSHDAILPFMHKGVKWGVPNVGDNQETNNLAIARVFDKIGEHLQAFSVRRDCFLPAPPTLATVKAHHNMFVRLNNLIDTNTKADNVERLEAAHVTHERRKFKIYPVRYFDVKNDYCRRWIELCLQGLANIAQLTENGQANDWSEATATEMKNLFREAYRLMCVELFQIDVQTASLVFSDETPFYLPPESFETYSTKHIPTIEYIKHPPLGSVFTEDELRDISTNNIPVSEGVPENQSNTAQRERERMAQSGVVIQ